jgi:hypothetical protein
MGDLNIGTFIVMFVQMVIFLTPVLLIFYKQGRKDQILDRAVRDINGLGEKVSEIRNSQTQALAELKAQIDNVNNTLIRVTTSMEFISSSIKELKKV